MAHRTMQPDQLSDDALHPSRGRSSINGSTTASGWGSPLEAELLAAIDAVFARHERLWQESKQEAIQALSSGFAEKMAR